MKNIRALLKLTSKSSNFWTAAGVGLFSYSSFKYGEAKSLASVEVAKEMRLASVEVAKQKRLASVEVAKEMRLAFVEAAKQKSLASVEVVKEMTAAGQDLASFKVAITKPTAFAGKPKVLQQYRRCSYHCALC